MNEDEPLYNINQTQWRWWMNLACGAVWVSIRWEGEHMWCLSERRQWKLSNCYDSGIDEGRKGVHMYAHIYTFNMQAQMRTHSHITAVIHHGVENQQRKAHSDSRKPFTFVLSFV